MNHRPRNRMIFVTALACLILPALCYWAAERIPIGLTDPPIGKPFAYVGLAMELLVIVLGWHVPTCYYHLRLVFAGVLLAGTFVGLAIGAMLLPYSLAGLLVGVGLLGFVPFMTATVYGIQARGLLRSVMSDSEGLSSATAILLLTLGLLLACLVPLAVHTQVSNRVHYLIGVLATGPQQEAMEAADELERLQSIAVLDLSPVAQRYRDSTSELEREWLDTALRQLNPMPSSHVD